MNDLPLERLDHDRFWSHVDKTDACWNWIGARAPGGYGQFGIQRKRYRANRISWALAFGPIPDGLLVCHHCDNPPCVRPSHLFVGTMTDNLKDAVSKGRMKIPPSPPGEANQNCRHSDETIALVRRLSSEGLSQRKIGARVGMAQRYVGLILSGKRRALLAETKEGE